MRHRAADQVGELLAECTPAQQLHLLAELHPLLYVDLWDTRLAAARALGFAARALEAGFAAPDAAPDADADAARAASGQGCSTSAEAGADPAAVNPAADPGAAADGLLSLGGLDLRRVLQHGTTLLASRGTEYDVDLGAGRKGSERLEAERAAVRKRLGLDDSDAGGFGGGTEFISDQDLVAGPSAAVGAAAGGPPAAPKEDAQALVDGMVADGGPAPAAHKPLSARERNRLKRKAKQELKRAEKKRQGLDAGRPGGRGDLGSARWLEDVDTGQDLADGAWPFQLMVDQLCFDLLDRSWKVRHGAALGLREVLRFRAHAAVVGRSEGNVPTRAGAHNARNRRWIEDCAVRLLCVLALDRFGDYGSDNTVAPVRETCSQVVGLLSLRLAEGGRPQLCDLLASLKDHAEWHVRHGALLGLKYVFAAAPEAKHFTAAIFKTVITALNDEDDDVRSAASQALYPLVPELLAKPALAHYVREILGLLWGGLPSTNEVGSWTQSSLELLQVVYAHEAHPAVEAAVLRRNLPSLWPFFHHPTVAIRRAVARSFRSLTPYLHLLDAAALRTTLHVLFQQILLETEADIQATLHGLWEHVVEAQGAAAGVGGGAVLAPWFELAATPGRAKLKHDLLSWNYSNPGGARSKRQQTADALGVYTPLQAWDITVGGEAEGGKEEIQFRLDAGRALGVLLRFAAGKTDDVGVWGCLGDALGSGWFCAKLVGGLVVTSCFTGGPAPAAVGPAHAEHLAACRARLHAILATKDEWLCGAPLFREAEPAAAQLRAVCASLFSHFQPAHLGLETTDPARLSLPTVAQTAAGIVEAATGPDKATVQLRALAARVAVAADDLARTHGQLLLRAKCAAARAVVAAGVLPAKLNGPIQPLMEALKTEADPSFLGIAAAGLARLIRLCVDQERTPSPVGKLVKNLCTRGVDRVTLQAEALARTPVAHGALTALADIFRALGPGVQGPAPLLWDSTFGELLKAGGGGGGAAAEAPGPDAGRLLHNLWFLAELVPAMHADLHGTVRGVLKGVCAAGVPHAQRPVRLAAARCLAAVARTSPDLRDAAAGHVVERCVPLLDQSRQAERAARAGAVAAVKALGEALGAQLVPFVVLLLVPLIGCMSDPDPDLRGEAAEGFGLLMPLLPLVAGAPPPPGLSAALCAQSRRDAASLERLLDNSKIADYALTVRLHVRLRDYQQEGVNWLQFLRRFGLHGILADDMGLGKTLQAIAILAAAAKDAEASAAAPPDGAGGKRKGTEQNGPGWPRRGPGALLSIVVCPASLVSHWEDEIGRHLAEAGVLAPRAYAGPAKCREALRPGIEAGECNVLIASYETVRSDVAWLGGLDYLYAVLDEGHLIRNGASATAKATKRLKAKHRLILSGTPIQNNVLELWSLFDFLMPGFLGSQQEFHARYGRALKASQQLDAKRGPKGAAAAAAAALTAGQLTALDALHKQVTPFIMRRTKDMVLKDLPPKVIQDVYCDLSPLQAMLYQTFASSSALQDLAGGARDKPQGRGGRGRGGGEGAQAHVFQALMYLRKLCSHPKLVVDPKLPAHKAALQRAGCTDLQALANAPKFQMLLELLRQAGLGQKPDAEAAAGGDAAAGLGAGGPLPGLGAGRAHRVLVFAQLRDVLTIAAKEVLEPHGISYLRLDGAVPAGERYGVVRKFNEDPTISCLLLTTQVGGLGLNLTAADTVVFLEHDWNPMKDLQAMDRAHRLGQKHRVNVYRLLTRGTLEEKIMGLQQFKLQVANTVVTQQNASLQDMDTGQFLDLFSDAGKRASGKGEAGKLAAAARAPKKDRIGKMLEEIGGEGLDVEQYANEFNLDSFIAKIG